MDFIQKARQLHNNKYDYSKVKYKNNYTKVILSCSIHGEFKQTPNSHLSGHGCPLCSKYYDNKFNLKNNFIQKARQIHGDKYDYSKVEYKNGKEKVIIICLEHGEFVQQPKHHLSGHGCNKCSRNNYDNFIRKAKRIHGDKYDYSEVKYEISSEKVTIICPEHGKFEQSPLRHIKGHGCHECGKQKVIKQNTNNTDYFIQKARQIHGDKYDYSKVEYINNRSKIIIICLKHGEFEQTAMSHLNGHGCCKCAYNSWTKEDFINNAMLVHDDRYDYSLVDYTNAINKVKIICNKHGVFEQSPYNHIMGSGCHKCSLSTGQNQIFEYISSIYDKIVVSNDRKVISPYELDIFIPEKSLAIEYNGLYWHSYDNKESKCDKNKHFDKYQLCKNVGINLFQIWEHQWNEQKELIKSMISGKLGVNQKIGARKCHIINISNDEYKKFVNLNHLQGYAGCNVKIGLIYDNDLVCVCGFKNIGNFWEVSRFCSKLFINVVGGFSKILNYFIKNKNDNKNIISYANLDHSNGMMYKKSNFKLIKTTSPGYFYTKNRAVYSRQKFQKHKLKNKLEIFDENISESQNMFNNGYRRCWNSGNDLYLLKINNFIIQFSN